MELIIDKKTKSGRLIFKGELTVNHVAEVHSELLKALKKTSSIRLDLQSVTEIDVSVLQIFCSAHKTATKMKKGIELIDSPMEVAKNSAGLNGFLRQHGCSTDQSQTCFWRTKGTANG